MTTLTEGPMEAAAAVRAPEPHVRAGVPINVLVVEDDRDAAELVRIQLRSAEGEFQTEVCSSLRQAIRRLSQPGIDLVLLDLGLPELEGFRTCRALMQATEWGVPVVILTGDDRPMSREITLYSGASDYLIKNETTPAQLRESIRAAVSRHRLQHLTLGEAEQN